MKKTSLRERFFQDQWDFYERTIGNYSILIRIFRHIEDGSDLVLHMPKVFVEETDFDMCQITLKGDKEEKTGFYSLDNMLSPVDIDAIDPARDNLLSSRVFHDRCGCGSLFVYPLVHTADAFGHLVLARKRRTPIENGLRRELELLAEVLARSVQLSAFISDLREGGEAKLRILSSRLGMTNRLVENVIDQFPHALLLVNESGEVSFANEKARTDLGEGRHSLAGEKLHTLIPGIDEQFFETDHIIKGEIEYRSGNVYKLFGLESYPVKDGDGSLAWTSIVLKDVTGEKVTEEEGLHQGRMESIGRLAGGIAHDFNNLLTGVLGYASLMKRLVSDEKQLYRYADVIEGAARKASVLTQHLLNFSRRQKRHEGMVDINALLDDVLFLHKESFRDIQLVKNFDSGLPTIRGDEAELQHAFLNLCINSSDSMPQGGTLQVKTSSRAYFGNRRFALVEIRDSGYGISEELKKRIFEPYFTTKSGNSKLGMGLYLVDRVVRNHGGFIELQSEPDKGTCFSIYLPCSAGGEEAREKAGDLMPAVSGTDHCILVVDDEGIIRQLIARVLGEQGFRVVEAEDGKTAIRKFTENRVDLVVLDMIMPGMKGEEVLKALRTLAPTVRVLVSSGFMSEEQRERLKEYGVDNFLDKPFREDEIVAAVRKMVAKAGSAVHPSTAFSESAVANSDLHSFP